jgi:hypothetical protein
LRSNRAATKGFRLMNAATILTKHQHRLSIAKVLGVSMSIFRTESGNNLIKYLQDIGADDQRLRRDWAVKHFIAMGTTSIATGLWGCGKTAVFIDIGMHIACGAPWHGRTVKRGVVLHVALENPYDVEMRVAASRDRMRAEGCNVDEAAYVLYTSDCTLFAENGSATDSEKALIAAANKAAAYYNLPVSLIVIDTLAQAMGSGDENSATDSGIFTKAMQRLAVATGSGVTALAHPPKSGSGVRGSGALQANTDTTIELSYDAAKKMGTIKALKFRIGNPTKVTSTYRLESEVVGVDEDGENETVVLAVESRSGGNGLSTAIDEEGDAPPATDTPADKLGAALRVFRERVAGIADATGEKRSAIKVSAKEVFAALNRDRTICGLAELKDRTIVSRLLGQLVERGDIVKTGDNRRTEYRLQD